MELTNPKNSSIGTKIGMTFSVVLVVITVLGILHSNAVNFNTLHPQGLTYGEVIDVYAEGAVGAFVILMAGYILRKTWSK